MTDEQKWLLVFGRGWHPYEAIEDAQGEIVEVFRRMSAAGKLEGNPSTYEVRLRAPKEENESIRVYVASSPGVHTV